MSVIIKIIIVIISIFTGYVLYKTLETNVLIPSCLIKTEDCVKISYYKNGNSVLFNVPPSGYWIYVKDNKTYTYGQQNLSDCGENGTFESVYVTDLTKSMPLQGTVCYLRFDLLLDQKFKGVNKNYFYFKKDPKKIVDMFTVLTELQKRGIIKISNTT
jgi:hypothetical protein